MVGKLKYPEWADVTPATIVLDGEPSEDGSDSPALTWTGKVNLSETGKRVQDKDGRWVSLACVIHIKGDIFPEAEFKGGRVTVGAYENRTIVNYQRPRNPDGSVNHTRIEVI
jgi:hypothetical protein